MLYLNEKNKFLNVFFLKEEHLALLRSKRIPFDALPYLLFFPISKEDLLDIIEYQRFVEYKYFGRKFTTYKLSGDLKYTSRELSYDMDIFGQELNKIYESNKSYDKSNFLSVHCVSDTITFVSSNDGYLEEGFKRTDPYVPKSLLQAVLDNLGYHQTYFREPVHGKDAEGVGIAELISIITK